MPVIAIPPPTGSAGSADYLPCSEAEGVFEVLVDGRMVEATAAVGAIIAEVVFVAEFVVGDAFFEIALFVERRGPNGNVDAFA